MQRSKFLHAASGFALMFSAAPTAFAQTTQPDTDSARLSEIIVTARKRPELLSETPLAIVAVGGGQLRARGLSDLEGIANVTPGVSFREDVAGRAGPNITIRGVGFDDYHAGGSPSTAVNIDNIYQGSNAWITGQLFDVDRIEILKGPQGTLYGHNTTAGAVNVITNQPSQTPGGFLNIDYGSYDALKVEGAYGGPITDQLSGRLAIDRQSGGGFLTSEGDAQYAGTTPVPGVIPPLPLIKPQKDFGGADFWGVRGTLAYTPTGTTRIKLQVNYTRDHGADTQTDVLGRSATGFVEPDTNPYTFYANVLPFIHSNEVGGHLELEHDFDWATFTGIVGEQHMQRSYSLDPGSPLRAFDIVYRDNLDQTTVEARLNSRGSGPLTWVAGAYYLEDKVASEQTEDVTDLYRSVLDQKTIQHRQSGAVFGEADWCFLPRWTLTTGLRYTNDTASFNGGVVDQNPYGVSVVAKAFKLPVLFNNDYSNGDVSGRAVITYRPDASNTLYASVNRGYKSGGFDGATIFTASKALPFQPETLWAYEAGYKWFPKALPVTFTADAFYYDINNLQATAVQTISGITTNVRTNVAGAREYGAELQGSVKPLRSLELSAGVALLYSDITSDRSADPAEIARRVGKALPDAPPLSYNASARYTLDLPGDWSMIPEADVSYTGHEYKEIDHYIVDPGYLLVDAQLALISPGGRYSLSLWGRNLTNQVYFPGLIPAVSGTALIGTQRIVGAPRTAGVSLKIKF
jgi:iron complex outermembrane receptor protein